MKTQITRMARHVLNAMLPPQCLSCGEVVGAQGTVCAPCWSELDFIMEPLCRLCGFPFEFEVPKKALCGACTFKKPLFHSARSVFSYNDKSRHLVLGFKHGDKIHAAPCYGRWLARAGQGMLEDCDLVIPVPLHRWRLLKRRYNQAALLARFTAESCQKPYSFDTLTRRRATPPQRKNRDARTKNVAGAFTVTTKETIKNKHIVLIDDVYTTGATLAECTKILLKAGAKKVDALTLARVSH